MILMACVAVLGPGRLVGESKVHYVVHPYCTPAHSSNSSAPDLFLAHVCFQVGTLESGEIDYDDLKARLAANNSRPAIINVNIGTTVKGAVDDLDRVLDILTETGYTEDR
jgi:hypothetical protein